LKICRTDTRMDSVCAPPPPLLRARILPSAPPLCCTTLPTPTGGSHIQRTHRRSISSIYVASSHFCGKDPPLTNIRISLFLDSALLSLDLRMLPRLPTTRRHLFFLISGNCLSCSPRSVVLLRHLRPSHHGSPRGSRCYIIKTFSPFYPPENKLFRPTKLF